MVKNKGFAKSLEYRPAKPSDAKFASGLMFETFEKKATYIIGLGSADRAKKTLAKIFPLPGHRLSYEFTEMVLHDGRVIGLINSFPGRKLGKLDWQLDLLILKQYRLRGKIALIRRGFPLVFIKEAANDEFFLCNLAVKKGFRKQGIGTRILSHIEEQAQRSSLNKVSLIVHIDNRDARRFYDRNGFDMKAIHLESNNRVPYLGPGYQRMVKDLGK